MFRFNPTRIQRIERPAILIVLGQFIDHLLAAPEMTGPIAVVAPHVQYQYADPELEAQSAGRKLMMRAGPENTAAIKSKLREIRRELTKTGTGK